MGDNNIQRVSKINPPNISNKKAIIQSPDESEDDLDEANVANQNNEK